jgi:hypothetical protein
LLEIAFQQRFQCTTGVENLWLRAEQYPSRPDADDFDFQFAKGHGAIVDEVDGRILAVLDHLA